MKRTAKKKSVQLVKTKKMLKQGIAASRIILGEIASAVEWTMEGGYGSWAEYEDRQARQLAYEQREWLRDLERRKLVEIKRMGDKLMTRLTAKGWQQALRDRIKGTRKKCREGICLVIFDVPESHRRVRNTLRWVLADCGFSMVQKSVWMTRKDVLNPLCALLQGANLQQWVRIMLGNEVRQLLPQRTLTRIKEHTVKSVKFRAGKN